MRIYLDHAATTSLRREVLEKMLPYFGAEYANASSIHTEGRRARRAVENARRQIAAAVSADAGEIYFTSGGTESDNWAVRGVMPHLRREGKTHIISSAVEHPAMLRALEAAEREGFAVTYVGVDACGQVDPEQVLENIRPETGLISVMAANNETGTLQPIPRLGQIARERGILLHTDAVQLAGSVALNVKEWGVDLLSLSGHKFYGPKGVGALYVRNGVRMEPFMRGGEQEKALRAGTENLPAIVGMGEALSLAVEEMEQNQEKLSALRQRLLEGLEKAVPGCVLNGHPTKHLPGTLNLRFAGVEGESLLMRLDLAGIAASSGSACTSGSLETSHVLLAMGLSEEEARGSLRFSLGRENTMEEIDKVIGILPPIVEDLRSLRS